MARDKGSGSVYYDANKGVWRGSIEAGYTAKGTRRRIKVSAKTKRDALTKLKAREREIAKQGVSGTEASRATTVKAYSDAWLKRRETEVRGSTYNGDKWAMGYIVSTIGHRRLSQLGAGDVRRVLQAVDAKGLEATSAIRCHAALRTMLKAAVIDGHTIAPGALLVPPPEKNESPRDEIPLDLAVKILAGLKGNPQRLRRYLAFLQGMRPAEVLALIDNPEPLGLERPTIDLETHTLDVSWQVKELALKEKGNPAAGYRVKRGDQAVQIAGAWHLTRPKTSAGKRIIPMVPWVEDAYRDWLSIKPDSPYGLVFPRASMNPAYAGHPIRDRWDRDSWYMLLEDMQIPPKADGTQYVPYETRHTCASLLARLGVSDHIITMILGHASIVSTKAYLHVGQAEAMEALQSVGERLQLGHA